MNARVRTGARLNAGFSNLSLAWKRLYGGVGLRTDRADVSDRELAVLGELGELVGHAVNATESRRLFGAGDVVELSVSVADSDDPIVGVTADGDVRLQIVGLVAGRDAGHHAILEVTDGDADAVREALSDAGTDVRVVREDGSGALLDIGLAGATSLGVVAEHDAQLRGGRIADGVARYDLLVPTAEEGHRLLERLEGRFACTDLRSKQHREHPFGEIEGLSADRLADLTDRQQEALAAAYRAGYFEWPRDADAQTVAESLNITSPTLHNHLRKAQRQLFGDLFDRQDEQ